MAHSHLVGRETTATVIQKEDRRMNIVMSVTVTIQLFIATVVLSPATVVLSPATSCLQPQ